VQREDPSFVPNQNFVRDITNVAVGIIWQLSLVILPIYIVLQKWSWAGIALVVLVATSVYVKLNWYDRLEKAS
jgi:hypothetical protein